MDNVQRAVSTALALVAPLGFVGCSTAYPGDCNIPLTPFDETMRVDGTTIQGLIQSGRVSAANWKSASCEDVCAAAYAQTHVGNVQSISRCSLVLPETTWVSDVNGTVTCAGSAYPYMCEGRRPLCRGTEQSAPSPRSIASLGDALAAMAQLEASSVVAFDELASWLETHGAPASLVIRCRAAADDERRHTSLVGELASRHGAQLTEPVHEAVRASATAFEVAMHNAVEGCVHESFAALLASVRARRSNDPRAREVFASIAEDETRHGQLAWDLHEWLVTRLSAEEVERVEACRSDALAALPARARTLVSLMPAELGCLQLIETESIAATFARSVAA